MMVPKSLLVSPLSLLEWNSDSLSSHSEFHGLQNLYYRRQRLSGILSFGVVTSKNFSKLFTQNHTRSTNIDNNRSTYVREEARAVKVFPQ